MRVLPPNPLRQWQRQLQHDYDRRLRSWNGRNIVFSVAVSPDGQTLISSSVEKSVELWDLQTGKHNRTLSVHSSFWGETELSPDGQTLVARGRNGMLRLCHFPTGRLICVLTDSDELIRSVAFSPDGRVMVGGSDDGRVYVWRKVA